MVWYDDVIPHKARPFNIEFWDVNTEDFLGVMDSAED